MSNRPVLITGCQRSGTTLLHLMLDSHPEIHGIDEADYREEALQDYLSRPAYAPVVSFKLPARAHAVAALGRELPGLKVLWCLRDPRDVLASMLKLRLGVGPLGAPPEDFLPWAVHPTGAEQEIRHALEILPAEQALKEALARLAEITALPPAERTRAQAVFLGALCWRVKQALLMGYRQAGIRLWVVRYEALLAQPEAELARTLEFLGLAWHPDVLRHHELHHGLATGLTDGARPLDRHNTGRWKTLLSEREVALIDQICAPLSARLGYDLGAAEAVSGVTSGKSRQALPPFEQAYREALSWQQAGDFPRAIARLEALPARRRWPNPPEPERRLRIGYLSPDLRYHPVASFLAPILAHHDPDQVETIAYADHPAEDAMTARLRARAAQWRHCHGWSDRRLAEQIAADGIDILVDLAGHTAGNRMPLLKAKPAPLQVLYIGYPCTSGLAAMDYLISDHWVSPPEQDFLYTEAVCRQPDSFWCFEPPAQAPPVGPLPLLGNGDVTFGSFNNLSKLSPATVALWARVLQAVPAARLVLQALAFADAPTREQVRERFAAHGIAPERLDIREPILAFERFLAGYGEIDIALDPLPFNGGTTTCQALWMGVPVITLPGQHFHSRMGLSLLRQLDLAELVADSAQSYVDIAAALAADHQRLEGLRRTLRGRMQASPLCDGPGAARALENTFRSIWRAWCSPYAPNGRAAPP